MTVFELIKSERCNENAMIKFLSAIIYGTIRGVVSGLLDADEIEDIFGDPENDARNFGINTSVKVLLNMDAELILKEAANDTTRTT